MAKISGKEILARVKAQQSPEKVNMTFRVPKELRESFEKHCKRQEVSMNEVVIELIRAFLED